MADKLTVKVDAAGASKKIRALEKALASPVGAYRVIGARLITKIRLCFKLGIDPWGSPWLALKLRKGNPLRDTGRLGASVTAKADDTGVSIGTNLIQAPVHQFGATIVPVKAKRLVFPGPGGKGLIFAKKVVIPARPFLPLTKAGAVELPEKWRADVINALKAYLLKQTESA